MSSLAFLSATAGALERDHDSHGDDLIRRATRKRVRFFVDGALQTVGSVIPISTYEGGHIRGDRRAITEFTKRAKSNMMRTVASYDVDAVLLLGTLTYPGQFSTFPKQWKKDLDTWGKRMRRKHPEACVVWKLEAQERGAPHFHLLVYGVPWVDKAWLARTWYEVAGGGHEEHLEAGTKIEEPRCRDGGIKYASKAYITKSGELPDFWHECGRLWGVMGRKNAPVSRVLECEVSTEAALRYRRIIRRWHESCGRKGLGCGTQSVFGTSHTTWLRVLAWAEGGEYPRATLLPRLPVVWSSPVALR